MSEPAIARRCRYDARVAVPVALVARRDARNEIVEALGGDEFGVGAFDDVEGLLKLADGSDPALILLRVDDSSSGLIHHVESLTQRFAETPVIVIGASIECRGIRAALAAGAAGVVLQGDLSSTLHPCIRAALTGQTCVPRRYWRQIDPPALSSREKQILGLIVMGYSNGQIAEQLFLAESTVKSHLSSAFGKLGVHSRNEAVNLILDPDRGLGMGILALGGEPLDSTPATA
jgi:DNA-binding NarL/FixJ family response regulator